MSSSLVDGYGKIISRGTIELPVPATVCGVAGARILPYTGNKESGESGEQLIIKAFSIIATLGAG